MGEKKKRKKAKRRMARAIIKARALVIESMKRMRDEDAKSGRPRGTILSVRANGTGYSKQQNVIMDESDAQAAQFREERMQRWEDRIDRYEETGEIRAR